MYYRYKSRTRNLSFVKYLITAVITAGALYGVYANRHYFMFWKYTFTQMQQRIDRVKKLRGPDEREKSLAELARICGDFEGQNPLSTETYLMSGEVRYLLGEAKLKRSFSWMVIHNGVTFHLGRPQREEFLSAMKSLKKARALSGDEPELPYRIMEARAGMYSGYYGPKTCFAMLGKKVNCGNLADVEDVRLCAILHLLNSKEEEGIAILRDHGKTNDTVEGQLFMATAYSLARQYTSAIMQYQSVLKDTTSSETRKLAHINLGKIYYNQSLYAESLQHFNTALQIDERDMLLKIWIGKNYSAMGDKMKARAAWTEVLTSDSENEEAQKLLKLM